MTDDHECDWPEYRRLVTDAIESMDRAVNDMAKNVSQIFQEIALIKTTLEDHLRITKPLSRSEIELMIEKAQERKDGNGGRLSKEEIQQIVREVSGGRLGNNTWAPWKYVLLGAAIALPQIALEVAKVFTP